MAAHLWVTEWLSDWLTNWGFIFIHFHVCKVMVEHFWLTDWLTYWLRLLLVFLTDLLSVYINSFSSSYDCVSLSNGLTYRLTDWLFTIIHFHVRIVMIVDSWLALYIHSFSCPKSYGYASLIEEMTDNLSVCLTASPWYLRVYFLVYLYSFLIFSSSHYHLWIKSIPIFTSVKLHARLYICSQCIFLV